MNKLSDFFAVARAALAAAPLGTDGELIRRVSAVLLAIEADAEALAGGGGAPMTRTLMDDENPHGG